VIAYYSSTIFRLGGFSVINALLGSWGFGMGSCNSTIYLHLMFTTFPVNFVFALPAVYTIDTFGRRKLLLTTFPCMAACLLITGFAFYIDQGAHPQARIGTIAFGIYFFCVFYS
jgi:Sugar (and other) transporter